jgi:3',5'-cyclic AMP phosphodiesterase CpdA
VPTILHGSDLQYGKPYRPAVGEAFHRLAQDLGPDLVVVAGDLTQRAKRREFAAVREYLDRFDPPTVVTPGNHDVPLYRFWERVVAPHRNWRRYISPELDTVTRTEGMVCVALDSSAPHHAIVGGRLTQEQVAWAAGVFQDVEEGVYRVVVTHHHFVATPDNEGGRPLNEAPWILRAFEGMGVDLVLGGHVHQTHLSSSRVLLPDEDGSPGIPLVASGTAASSRGRGVETGKNSVNVVHLSRDEVVVEVHRFQVGSEVFEPASRHVFQRRSAEEPLGAWTMARA